MAAKTKVKEVKLTDEEKYAKAKELTQAVNCLTRDKERAEIYGTIAKKYRELGDYEDSAKRQRLRQKNLRKRRMLTKRMKRNLIIFRKKRRRVTELSEK